MRYLSVCSGIEAATVAWHPLGWTPAAFSEIEAFPRSVLAHHYPTVPCHGDFTTIGADEYGPIDLLVGGTPCQSFSVAGLRGGLGDDRGNLALEYLRLADRKRSRWLVWENVPGVLSSNGGRDFGAILGGMVELGYGVAYRVLDAQHFGVPQRRRRVFVVGHLGDWRRAAAVLFERHSLSGNTPPRRETGKVAPTIPSRSTGGGGLGTDFDCDGGLIASTGDIAMDDCSPTLRAGGHSGSHANAGVMPAVAFNITPSNSNKDFNARQSERAQALTGSAGNAPSARGGDVIIQSAVRRLTPRECEKLQGFPDDYSLVPHRGKEAADGPRYRALGNSMAVPVMRWIGKRIQQVDSIPLQDRTEPAPQPASHTQSTLANDAPAHVRKVS